jgi:hypothetical protein
MSMPTGQDPIDRLRAADPVQADALPDASLARVSAKVQEHIMTDIQHTTATSPRRPLAIIGGLVATGALVVAIGLSTGFGLGTGSSDPVGAGPVPTDNPAAGGGMASCLAYDPAILPTFDIVFDGTVGSIDGDQVTFDVETGWKGVDGKVTLTAPVTDIALVGPMPAFEVGGRYLVTAAGSDINACGYTLDYDAATAADWAAAFAS